ncbi:MAG: hypothetical protein AAF809_15595, partial [Bacteroidota bacterium]
TYGDPLRPAQQPQGGFLDRARAFMQGNRDAWHTDAERWRFRLNPVVPDSARYTRVVARDEERALPPDAIWSSGPVEDDEEITVYLDVPAATRVWVDATGELFDEPIDYGWVDDLVTGERVWAMAQANTRWAGGSAKNRRFRDTLRLDEGRYLVGFQTDDSHAYQGWTANPPFDPDGWGLTLGGSGTARVFEPYTDLPEIVVLRKVGDDARDEAQFTLTRPTRVFVWALGELREDERYDYARLVRLVPDGPTGIRPPETVWEMEYDDTRHGGGTSRNRLTDAVLDLEPGRYALLYQTDGSHSPDDWHGSAPDHPERWGAALFALNRDFDPASVTEVNIQRGSRAGANVTVAAPPPPAPPDAPNTPPDAPNALPTPEAIAAALQPLPLDVRRLTNNQRLTFAFELDAETTLRIDAIGEISGTNRYDYAWITRAEDAAVVWEMTAENTVYAGGAPRNQRFEGTVTLPAGTYLLHVRSDDSHAFGNFISDPPEDPDAWGIFIEEV